MDDERFREFCERWRDELVAYLKRSKWRERAEDIAHETLMKVRDHEIDQRAEWTYLRTASIRVAINQDREEDAVKRGGGETVSVETVAEPERQEALAPDERAIASIELQRLRKKLGVVMNALSPETPQIIALRHSGHTSKEIARLLGLTHSNVRTLLMRAEELFRHHLGQPPAGVRWLDIAGEDHDHET